MMSPVRERCAGMQWRQSRSGDIVGPGRRSRGPAPRSTGSDGEIVFGLTVRLGIEEPGFDPGSSIPAPFSADWA